MRLVLILLVIWSCNEDDSEVMVGDTANSNVVGEQINPWTVSTSEDDKDDTVDTYFVNRRSGYPSDCIVIDAQQELLDKMDGMLGATNNYDEAREEYKEELKGSDILCYAKYHNGRKGSKDRNLVSFYHGTSSLKKKSSYQVLCFVPQGSVNYICRDIVFRHYNDGKNFVVVEDKDSVGDRGINGEIKALDYYAHLTYDGGKRMLRVPVSDLRNNMRVISPERSVEIPQFKKMVLQGGRKWVQRFERIIYNRGLTESEKQQNNLSYRQNNSYIYPLPYRQLSISVSDLPSCMTGAGSVSSDRKSQGILEGDPHGDNSKLVGNFKKLPVCKDLFLNPHNGFCRKELKEQEIRVCKLDGRGILIKQGKDKILRVANCEYQAHAKHFYCSGKEPGSNEPPKIYFERYGVFIKMHDRLPRAYCPARLAYMTDSIGCGSCSTHKDDKYDIAKVLEARGGCDYNTPHYCNFFSELEESWNNNYYGINVTRPNRCRLESTCVFRRSSSVSDNPPCNKNFKELLIDVETNPNGGRLNGCSTKFDNGDRCHFMQRQEVE